MESITGIVQQGNGFPALKSAMTEQFLSHHEIHSSGTPAGSQRCSGISLHVSGR